MYAIQRNFSLPGSRYDAFDEPSPLDFSKDPAENMRDVLNQITSKEEMSVNKRMCCVNNFTKLIQNIDEKANLGFSYEDIMVCLVVPLTMRAKEVRAAGLRALRHLFSDESMFLVMLKLRLDILIVKSMDTIPDYEVERVQALRLIRKVVAVCPRSCPISLAASLVSTGSDDKDEPDRLKRACLATLCELAVKNTPLSSFVGGIQAITRNVLDCQMPRLNESLIITLLYLLNYKKTRKFVRLHVGLEGILAPFTDLHYRHSADTPDSQMKEDKSARLTASKLSLVTIFRSWAGIMTFCKPDGKGLQSLLGVFCLQNSDVRKGIMEVLAQVFKIKEPTWTDDFDVALNSVDPSQMKEAWKLSDGFVAQEGRELLPRATKSTGRTNLITNYMALVLSAFINAGLLESLVEVITSSDCFISVRATILLGELLHLANTLLPPECSSHTHCLPTLVNTATSCEVSAAERGLASAAVNCLDHLHQMKKRGPVPCSLYLDQITRALEPKVKPDKQHKDRLLQCINKQELEEPYLAAIRDSQVMAQEYRNWDWDLIEAALQSPFISMKKIEENNNQRFVRNLLNFYKPSSQKFSSINLSDPRAENFSRVGLLLIDFLMDPDDPLGIGCNLIQELVQEIAACLQEVLSPNMASNSVLNKDKITNLLSRDYFLFLGKLSSTKAGCKLLDKTGIFQYLLDLCSTNLDNLLKLIVASLDYRDKGIPRIILSKILTASPDPSSRLYATSHMRVLLRSKIAFFSNWGMEFLVTQLYDTNPRVANEAADVLDEACEDEANLQYLVQLRPVLLHLGDKGVRLLTRFVTVERGFSYLSSLGYLEVLLRQWQEQYKVEYVRWIDEMLAESLTTYTKPTDDESYVRRSNKKHSVSDAYLPPHLYGELVQKKHGFKLLQKTNEVENCVSTIRTLEPDSQKNVSEIKAALWALGHCGSSNWGITLLLEEDIIPDIVAMAEESDNMAIRGTCYYVLGLIAKTRQGAEILSDHDWISIRHIGTEEWPVVESQDQIIPAVMFGSPVNPSPTYPGYNLSKISEKNDNGIYMGDDVKKAADSSYDELSGIYIGDDSSTKKPTHEDRTEGGGILARWYEEAERRRKIAKRETGLYDDASGVYLGNEKSPQKSLLNQDEFVPGGIMAKLYQNSSLNNRKENKTQHRRNRSDGNFSSSTSSLNDVKDMDSKLKRRTYSNVDRLQSSVDGSPTSNQDSGVEIRQMRSMSESTTSDNPDEPLKLKRDALLNSESRTRYDSTGSELTVTVSHARTGSNVSSVSAGSVGYHDREASFDSSMESDDPPGYSSNSPDTKVTPNTINPPPKRLLARKYQSEDKDKLKPQDGGHPILMRQRSISLTEKQRTKSPTLALIAENRSSSFHGSTEFSKITSTKRSTGEIPVSRNSSNVDDDIDLLSSYTSTTSLTEVKILSDKTIVFHSSVEKDRAQSFDSSHTSDLRRDRLLVSGSQLSDSDAEIGAFKPRSRTSSYEKAELARRLGLKSGDISQRAFNRSRSTSSGYGPDGFRKKIVNNNSLLGNTNYVTISGDSNKHARSSSDLGAYTTMRDASGYVALSTLRRQHSLSREALVNADRPYFTAAPASTDTTSTRESLSSSSGSYEYRQLTSSMSSSSTGTEFVGLCLPLNLSLLFQVEPYVFEGSWPDNFVSDPITPGTVSNVEGINELPEDHDPSRCLGCMYSKRTKSMNERRKSIDSFSDAEKISYQSENTEDSQSSVSPSSVSSASDSVRDDQEPRKALDGSSPGGRVQIRKEILRLVVKLSSAVGSKSHQEGLSQLKGRFPDIFQDVCLFCEVVDLMSVYQFRLATRRFLLNVIFNEVAFTEIIERADAIINGSIMNSTTALTDMKD